MFCPQLIFLCQAAQHFFPGDFVLSSITDYKPPGLIAKAGGCPAHRIQLGLMAALRIDIQTQAISPIETLLATTEIHMNAGLQWTDEQAQEAAALHPQHEKN